MRWLLSAAFPHSSNIITVLLYTANPLKVKFSSTSIDEGIEKVATGMHVHVVTDTVLVLGLARRNSPACTHICNRVHMIY